MFSSTETHWQWTAVAEAKWDKHHIEPRRAGQSLMIRDNSGEWVKRQTVPRSWVDKGYVQEADGEQLELFLGGV